MQKFRDLARKNRLKFAVDKKLCFTCLRLGQRAAKYLRNKCFQKKKIVQRNTRRCYTLTETQSSTETVTSKESAKCSFVGSSVNNTSGVALQSYK